jgi:hypothetical protein
MPRLAIVTRLGPVFLWFDKVEHNVVNPVLVLVSEMNLYRFATWIDCITHVIG